VSDLAEWIAPGRTALLVVDMQVDFAASDGAMARLGADLSDVPAALAAAERLAEAARAADVPVVFLGISTSPADDPPAWKEWWRRRGGDPATAFEVCRAGTIGTAFIGPHPRIDETVIAKLRYSGFHETDLDEELRAKGVDTLVVCGLTTDCCVDCTVRDAFHRDYHVILVRDACAAYERDLHEGALRLLEANFALLAAADDVVAAWTR